MDMFSWRVGVIIFVLTIVYGLIFYYGMAYRYYKVFGLNWKDARLEVRDLLQTYYRAGKQR